MEEETTTVIIKKPAPSKLSEGSRQIHTKINTGNDQSSLNLGESRNPSSRGSMEPIIENPHKSDVYQDGSHFKGYSKS